MTYNTGDRVLLLKNIARMHRVSAPCGTVQNAYRAFDGAPLRFLVRCDDGRAFLCRAEELAALLPSHRPLTYKEETKP